MKSYKTGWFSLSCGPQECDLFLQKAVEKIPDRHVSFGLTTVNVRACIRPPVWYISQPGCGFCQGRSSWLYFPPWSHCLVYSSEAHCMAKIFTWISLPLGRCREARNKPLKWGFLFNKVEWVYCWIENPGNCSWCAEQTQNPLKTKAGIFFFLHCFTGVTWPNRLKWWQ